MYTQKGVIFQVPISIIRCYSQDLSSLCTEVIDCISRRTATQENYEQQLNDSDHLREFKPKSALRKNKEWMLKIVLKLKDAADVNAVAQQLCLIEMVSIRLVILVFY